jgi:glycosyltransferase involved in cell wall biosynthesis
MKILHLNTSDNFGGAARAAFRLHQALNVHSSSFKSDMLVLKKGTDDLNVYTVSDSVIHKIRPFLETLPLRKYKTRKKVLFSSSYVPFSGIIEKINKLNPDIVHLHWINDGFLRIEDLKKINRPIVWSLHDMWVFTGGCHIDLGCGKFKKGCGACPVLNSIKENDLSKRVFQRKLKTYLKIQKLTIVGLSKWICRCAEESTILKNTDIVNLPNLIDTGVFKKIDKKNAREILSLDENKKYILFGAMNATSNPNKGFEELTKALMQIKNEEKTTELLVFGSSGVNSKEFIYDLPVKYLGMVHDDVSLMLIYNAADLVVVPSKQENLSNVIMESLSCGTPVVCFDIGGNGDMIDHKLNGYLVDPYNIEDLANGIYWLINHPDIKTISEAAINKIKNNFRSEKIAKMYESLYKDILKDV